MTRTGRIGLALALGLGVLGLLLAAAASTTRWVTAVPPEPVPGSGAVPLKGSAVLPGAVPLALMGTAGLIAAAAAGRMARGVLRGLATVLVVLAGLGLAGLALRALSDPAAAIRGVEAAKQVGASQASDRSPVGVLSVVGGLAIAVAGAVALATGGSWPGLAARYERDPSVAADTPDAGSATADPAGGIAPSDQPGAAWDALERGDDPTA